MGSLSGASCILILIQISQILQESQLFRVYLFHSLDLLNAWLCASQHAHLAPPLAFLVLQFVQPIVLFLLDSSIVFSLFFLLFVLVNGALLLLYLVNLVIIPLSLGSDPSDVVDDSDFNLIQQLQSRFSIDIDHTDVFLVNISDLSSQIPNKS